MIKIKRYPLDKRIFLMAFIFTAVLAFIILRYFDLATKAEYAQKAMNYGKYTVKVNAGDGLIYDRNFIPLVNEKSKYITVIANSGDITKYRSIASDRTEFNKLSSEKVPFAFESICPADENIYSVSFEIPVRYSENQPAQHLIGYSSQGEGVSGLEYAYNRILRNSDYVNTVTYNCDGFGGILWGEGRHIEKCNEITSGVVTTIDYNIQHICERASEKIEKGAVLVADIKTGDILAMVSRPTYSLDDLETALNDENSPMINRCLYSYSIGSIFKLVTACEAIKSGYADFLYDCTGEIEINGQIFKCHDHNGHGQQDLTQAMANSCNTYFIALSKLLDVENLRDTAFTLGFGREIQLCAGVNGSAGILPTVKELSIPAELANFSFGQGILTATPLQVCQMTCAIANNGNMPVLRVIRGLTDDGINVKNEKEPQLAYTMEEKEAKALRRLMASAINNNDSSNAKPYNVMAAGKTSTAQTGRFDENGIEYCNAWITGYFPVNEPKYAITVLVEDGGYVNDSAAPVFREIIEKIQKNIKSN